jgi:hypothetical protein
MIRETGPSTGRMLSRTQEAAIRTAMRLFLDDDLGQLNGPNHRVYCDACQRSQPAAGSIRYRRYQLCNACATQFELALARGFTASAGQFVRDRQFGESFDLMDEVDAVGS